MATSTITGLTGVTDVKLTDAAVFPVDDSDANTRKATLAQVRTAISLGITAVGQGGYLSASQAIPDGSTSWHIVVINTSEWGTGFLNTGTGVWTVPTGKGGVFRFDFRTEASVELPVRIMKNGSTPVFSNGDAYSPREGSRTLPLAAGDTIAMEVKGNGGNSIGIVGGLAVTFLSLARVGDS
jgi:hypothetical protein